MNKNLLSTHKIFSLPFSVILQRQVKKRGMREGLAEEKQRLRRQMQARLQTQPVEERRGASIRIGQHLLHSILWQTARRIAFFASTAEEVDLFPLLEEALRQGKEVYLPRFWAEERIYRFVRLEGMDRLRVGRFGILEPISDQVPPNRALDLILVPGLAFDEEGRRLGRGRGYYDRLLREYEGARCGVGFDWQVVPHVPTGPTDVKMDWLLTPSGLRRVGSS